MWNVISTILGTLIGVVLWREQMGMKDWIGITLGCVALYLLNDA